MENNSYRSFLAILGLIFGPIWGQKCSKKLRKPNEAIFPHSLKHLVWILIEKSFWAILGLIFGPILGQKSSRRLREANKATFPHSLRNWVWILLENIKFWLLGSFLGVLYKVRGSSFLLTTYFKIIPGCLLPIVGSSRWFFRTVSRLLTLQFSTKIVGQ